MPSLDTPWIENLTIGEMLRETARKYGDRDALVFPHLGFKMSYAALDAEADLLARGLLAIGIERGDRVAVWATNWPRWVVLQFATARVGAILVTINPAYRSHELAYVLKQSESKALFLIDKFRTSDYFAMLAEAVPELASSRPGELLAAEFPFLKHVVSMSAGTAAGMWSWEEVVARGGAIAQRQLDDYASKLDCRDAINIQYTSGTTGFPKGATLTHRNLLMNGYYIGDCQNLSERDRICIPVPFYHCFGCVLGVLCAGVWGSAMVIPAEHFNPEATLEAIEKERATSIYGVPTMFIAQLEHPTFVGRDLKSLRTGIMAGSPCPIEIMQRVVNDMGAEQITIGYGLTEAAPIITQTRTDDPLELRVKTVGRPIPGAIVKLVNPATGETLGDNEQGELCTQSHGVMIGYYNMPEATAAAIDADGWLHSGDLAVRLPNGYYRITGRIKDMVCRGGENVYPREIEEFLYTHPAIQDVAVVGVPDPKFVEEVAAWIKLKPELEATEEEIRQFCKGQLAHYKIPRYIRFVSEFPQTVTGKIQKFRIREMMIEELGLSGAAQREMA